MSDASIRRERLRSLRLGPNELVARGGSSYSYWRDLMQDDKKSFGEKAARSIEEKLGLPRGWLDQVADPDVSANTAPLKQGGGSPIDTVHPYSAPPLMTVEDVLTTDKIQGEFRFAALDDAVADVLPRGWHGIFDPSRTPAVGRLVLVQVGVDQLHVRRYAQGKASGQWRAVPDPGRQDYASFDSAIDPVRIRAVLRGTYDPT